MYKPLRLGLVIWIAMILATMKMPPPPAPVITRPKTKCSNDTEVEVMINPVLINMVEKNMHRRGLNTWHSRPIKGASDDMAMRYADVNQLAFSNASKSAAMEDCVVVRMEILVACRNISKPTLITINAPLDVEMAGSSCLPSVDKGGDVEC